MTERSLPGPTPSGGAYGVVRYLDAEGKPSSPANASSLVFEEYAPDGTFIASTSAALSGDEGSGDDTSAQTG